MRRLVILCTVPLVLSGCVSALVTAGTETGMAVAENRSIGRKVDDTVIYTDLTNQFIQADKTELLGKVTFNVRYARVMLTGNVKSEEDAQQAVALSWKAKGVTEVINELVVNPDASLMTTANDALTKRNLESRLLMTKGVWVINYSIDVQGGMAFLIGRVKDQAELDRALNVARTTKGVKRVVSHLQINTDTVHPTQAPGDGGTQPYSATSSSSSSSYSSSSSNAPVNSPNPGTGSNDAGVYTGPVYTNSGASTATSRTVEAPGSVSSAPLAAPTGGGY